MPITDETVKVINHGIAGERRFAGAVGVVVGLLAGAGATKVLLDSRQDPEESFEHAHGGSGTGGEAKGGNRRVGAFDEDAAGIDDAKDRKGIKAKVLRLGERKGWHWLGRAIQVQRRYGELRGNNLAAAVTLQTFLSLFPLLLVAAAVLGFVLHNSDTDVAGRVVGAMGLKDTAAESMRSALETAQQNRKTSSVVGLLSLVWSAIGVSSALQYAYDQAWQVGGRGLKDKAIGAVWLAGAALLFVLSAATTTALRWLPASLGVIGIVVSVFLSLALWMFTARVLPNVKIGWRTVLPGAILGVVGLEILKLLGAYWVPRAVASSSALYGTIGVVFAVLAWLLLFGKLVVYTGVLNVVLDEGKTGVVEQTIQMPKAAAASAQADGGGGVVRSGQADTN